MKGFDLLKLDQIVPDKPDTQWISVGSFSVEVPVTSEQHINILKRQWYNFMSLIHDSTIERR